MIILYIFTTIIFIYLFASVAYIFILAVAGRMGKLATYSSAPVKSRIAVIIPSYKEDNVIIQTATEATKQDYPADKFSVTVIADCLQPETILALKAIPVNVVTVAFEKSMKAKSINAAFEQLSATSTYDLALILDADNVMEGNCLQKVNHAHQQGWQVIQCHRTAKNKNTSVAILDGMSEEINNTIFRKGQRVVGLSCALIGSGMAFKFDLLKEIFALPQIQNNPGEDREVDVQLVSKGIVVEYIENAYVYDEKVQRKEVFEKQRTRWLATQVDHFKRFLAKDLRGNFGKKIYTHKLFQCLLLPRLLMLLLFLFIIAICVIDGLVTTTLLFPAWPWWCGVIALYFLTLLIAIPSSFYNRQTLKAILKVPVLMLSMVKALLKIGKNKGGFLHTPKEFPG